MIEVPGPSGIGLTSLKLSEAFLGWILVVLGSMAQGLKSEKKPAPETAPKGHCHYPAFPSSCAVRGSSCRRCARNAALAPRS